MVSELDQAELECLSMCLHVATENLAFYKLNYQAMRIEPQKSILGRSMAQKKEFIHALNVLFKARPKRRLPVLRKDCDIEHMPRAVDNPNQREVQKFSSMLSDHEGRYRQALEVTLSKVRNPATRFMLMNHLEAAKIGLSALNNVILTAKHG